MNFPDLQIRTKVADVDSYPLKDQLLWQLGKPLDGQNCPSDQLRKAIRAKGIRIYVDRGENNGSIGKTMDPTTSYTKIEQEVIALKAIWEQIDDLVNYELFEKPKGITDVLLMFKTAANQRLFNALLCDFLSNKSPFGLVPVPSNVSESEENLLFHLKQIAADPKLNPAGGTALRMPADLFTQ